jgi:hypothetical protein
VFFVPTLRELPTEHGIIASNALPIATNAAFAASVPSASASASLTSTQKGAKVFKGNFELESIRAWQKGDKPDGSNDIFLTHWSGTDSDGNAWEPSWEPVSSFKQATLNPSLADIRQSMPVIRQ